jgi:hypothetical protein
MAVDDITRDTLAGDWRVFQLTSHEKARILRTIEPDIAIALIIIRAAPG